jgi:hypothetical protein
MDLITAITLFTATFGQDSAAELLGDDLTLEVRNQNHATAIWLDFGLGQVQGGNEALQAWLEATCGGAKSAENPKGVSPVAASQRLTIQASNQPGWTGKVYHCHERDRTVHAVIRAAGRSGQVRRVKATEEQAEQLLAILGKSPVAEAAK